MSGFHVFLPVPPGAAGFAGGLPAGCTRARAAGAHGTLYDVPGRGRVLLLYGDTRVAGEIWRCPWDTLAELDARAGVAEGVRQRAARRVHAADGAGEVPCWVYVAGPALARALVPERRVT